MTKQSAAIAHPELVGGGQTALHSHVGGGGGFTYTAVNPPTETNVSSTSTWEDWDLSGALPAGAKYAVIYMRNNASSAYYGMVRKKGQSEITSTIYLRYYAPILMIAELDANLVIERYATSTQIKFSVLGYVT
jgi:hypothetical protein